MEIRSHEISETIVKTVPSKYIIVTTRENFFLIPEECIDDLDEKVLSQYSVLTLDTRTDSILKSRFF